MTTTREEYERRRHELADHMLEHPQEFDIGTFGEQTACGTTACIAGTAAFLAANQGLLELNWYEPSAFGVSQLRLQVTLSDGSMPDVDDWAKEYLGLRSTSMFFDGSLHDAEIAAKTLLEAAYVDEES
jgi:hypothetical protein